MLSPPTVDGVAAAVCSMMGVHTTASRKGVRTSVKPDGFAPRRALSSARPCFGANPEGTVRGGVNTERVLTGDWKWMKVFFTGGDRALA